MKTYITVEDISTAMHQAGVEAGKTYAVQKVIWKNGLIAEIHTLKGKFIPHGTTIHDTTIRGKSCNLFSLVGIDWVLEFES